MKTGQSGSGATERHETSDGTLVLRSERNGEVRTIALAGELDLSNAATVEAELEGARSDEGGVEIVVDMRELEFIDSTGIALLVATLSRDDVERPRVRFVPSSSAAVTRVLDLTGLSDRLPRADA